MSVNKKFWIILSALVVFVIVIVSALVAGLSSKKQGDVGSISNAPESSSVSVEPSSESSQSADSESASPVEKPFTDEEMTQNFEKAINSLTGTDVYNDKAHQYFYSYKKHLPDVLGIRQLGHLKVSETTVNTASSYGYKFKVSNDSDRELATITAYYIPDIQQFKVVNVEMTEFAQQRVPNGPVDEAELM